MEALPKPVEYCPNPICDNEKLVQIGQLIGALVCPNCDLVVLYSSREVDVYVPPEAA